MTESSDGRTTELQYTGIDGGHANHLRQRTICTEGGVETITATKFVSEVEVVRQLEREPCAAGSGTLAAAAFAMLLTVPEVRARLPEAQGGTGSIADEVGLRVRNLRPHDFVPGPTTILLAAGAVANA